MATEPLFVSVKEAARLLGLSVWTVRDLIKSGDIEAREHSSRRWLVSYESLRQYGESLPNVRETA